MQANMQAGPTSTGAGPFSCAKSAREPTPFERGDRGVTVGRAFAAARDVDPAAKWLLVVMHGLADDDGVCRAGSLELAQLAGIVDDAGEPNRQQVQRLQRRLLAAGRLVKHARTRGIYHVVGMKPAHNLQIGAEAVGPADVQGDAAEDIAYLASLVTREESSASRMTRARSGDRGPEIGRGPAPRRLTPDELATLRRMIDEAARRGQVPLRYGVVRYALGCMYQGGAVAPFTEYHGVEAMTHAWRRGIQGLRGRDERIAVEFYRAGVILRMMKGDD